jgi:hypothetical protein
MNRQNNNSLFERIMSYGKTKEPLEQEVGDFLRANTKYDYEPKMYSNDLRHRYASAIFAQKYSPLEARILGGLNEGLPLSGVGDMITDLDNNRIGREYAEKYPHYTKQQFLEQMFKDMKK